MVVAANYRPFEAAARPPQVNPTAPKAQRLGKSFAEIEAAAFSYTSIAEYVTPRQIADQCLFIASERGRTISGQALSVCGDTRMLAWRAGAAAQSLRIDWRVGPRPRHAAESRAQSSENFN
ncbi:hypothetical protein [Rubrimonas cliftonensis]|nr:hypothetical protein [Rubrimonas cliftonensis]